MAGTQKYSDSELLAAMQNAKDAGDNATAVRIAKMMYDQAVTHEVKEPPKVDLSKYAPLQNDPSASGGGTIPFGPFDTHIPMSQGVDRFLSGMGQSVYETGRGISQMFGGQTKADTNEQSRMDAPLLHTGAGFAGNLMGNLAGFMLPGVGVEALAAKVVPKLATAAPLATKIAKILSPEIGGSGYGAISPVGTDQSRLGNAGYGAIAGGVLHSAGQSLGSGARTLINKYASKAADPALSVKPSYMTAIEPANDAERDVDWKTQTEWPDKAIAVTARDPQTNQLLSRQVLTHRGDNIQSLRMDTHPDYQGQGIGSDVLHKAIGYAHDQNLPFTSDTQVSVPAMKTYLKARGVNPKVNAEHDEVMDANDGMVASSANGRPMVHIDPEVHADDAQDTEIPSFNPNSYAGGGGIARAIIEPTVNAVREHAGPILGDVGAMIRQLAEKGGFTKNLQNGTDATHGYAVSTSKGLEQQHASIPTVEQLHNYVELNKKALSQPGNHFGAWSDPESGNHFLDVTHVEPDFGSAIQKARDNQQLAIFDLAHGHTIPTTDDYTHFTHYGNPDLPELNLDPNKMGTGIKGAEARRGGPKVISVYAHDNAAPEPGLESKTPYRVTIPSANLYDANKDPLNLKADATYNNNLDMSDYESAIKGAGFHGYHIPDAEGQLRGQARLFQPTNAVRIGPGSPADDLSEDFDHGMASGGLVSRYDEGGAIRALMKPAAQAVRSELIEPGIAAARSLWEKYAGNSASQLESVANTVADTGHATYNPTSGDIHTEGYAVPAGPSASLDHAPTGDEMHDFMAQHQDSFDNPKAALHIESDDSGNHFMHVAHHENDFDSAVAAAHQFGQPAVRELHTGNNLDATGPVGFDSGNKTLEPEDVQLYGNDNKSFASNALVHENPASRPLDEYDFMHSTPAARTNWTPGQQTVNNPVRLHTAGIYGDTKSVVDQAAELAAKSPEDPMMHQLFGVTRQDLADIGAGRQGNLMGQPLGYRANPQGSAAALNVMVPKNAQRLVDALEYAKTKPELSTGMTGWYVTDPAYQRILHLVDGDTEKAKAMFDQLNTFQAVSSPQTPVDRELEIAGTAHWLRNSGRWKDFEQMANAAKENRPQSDLADLMTHLYHNSQNVPAMNRYLEAGKIGSVPMQAPKAYTYGEASNIPDIGNQTRTPVGDTHFAGALGLLDTRTSSNPKGSLSTEELQTLSPWFRSNVSDRAGMEPVPAQANLWGIFAPQTGVRSGIGMPKLELMTQQIKNIAAEKGVSPETARDMYLMGKR